MTRTRHDLFAKQYFAALLKPFGTVNSNSKFKIQNSKFKINCSGLLETTVLTRSRADDSRGVVAHGITRAESLHSRSAF
jgi:hypothetical protein